MAFGHFQIIPVNGIVSGLHIGNAGAFALPLAQLFQRFAAAAAQGAQFVQLGIVAFADDISVGNTQGRLFVYGLIEQLGHFLRGRIHRVKTFFDMRRNGGTVFFQPTPQRVCV